MQVITETPQDMLDKLFVALQHLLPARTMGRAAYVLARSERPWICRPLIFIFMRLFAVDLTEAEATSARAYRSFNAFFTRRLKPGARPISADPADLCCPADGYVQRHGELTDGQLIQAKGMRYSAQQLVGGSADELKPFSSGSFITVYLAPHNYHRVHMPLAGQIETARFIPGKLFSVNKATTRAVPELFVKNERLACLCHGEGGPFWLVFVGALNVASISTAWCGEVKTGRSPTLPAGTRFGKGDYLGHFNMGSTVILLFPENTVRWASALHPGRPLRVGEPIGRLVRPV